jgi:hypothetical protein
VRFAPTAYSTFLSEKLRDGFDHKYDPKEVKKDATLEWAKMSNEQKQVYEQKKNENNNWLQKAKKIKKINHISLFVQKKN